MTIDAEAPPVGRAPRPEKVAVVDDVRERLARADAAILTEYRGLRVAQMAELRRALAGAGGSYKVYKNTLVRRAAEEGGVGAVSSLLEGPTAIAFVEGDVAAVAKVLRDFARTHPALVVKGGLLGSSLLDARGAQALADLPSREVLLAQLAGLLAAPMQRFAALLAAVPLKMAYGLQALIDARGGAETAEEAPPAAAETPAAEAPAEEAPAEEAPAAAETAAEEAPAAAETPAEEAPAAAETPAEEAPAAAAPAAVVPEDTTGTAGDASGEPAAGE